MYMYLSKKISNNLFSKTISVQFLRSSHKTKNTSKSSPKNLPRFFLRFLAMQKFLAKRMFTLNFEMVNV